MSAAMKPVPWDQRLARVLVRPLAATAVRPNHISLATLLMALISAVLIARGPEYAGWGTGIFVLSRFLDHFDGELARIQGTSSKLGYYLDYAVGGIGYAALFASMGICFFESLGTWSLVLGGAGSASALISLFSNLEIDRKTKDTDAGEAVGYPGFAGFELEDGIYLIAPVTWLGFLEPFFVAAGIGAAVYCLWTIVQAIRLR